MKSKSNNPATGVDPVQRHGAITQGLHWLTALALAVLIFLAVVMVDLPLGLEKYQLYNWHKSIGLTVLGLMILRLIWRRLSPAPPLPKSLSPLDKRAAAWVHRGLYGLIILQALIGIGHSWVADFPIVVFDLFSVPNPLGPSRALAAVLVGAHGWLGWIIVVLIIAHVGAAMRHHFVLKDAVLARMAPGLKPRGDGSGTE
ncbi:MAG: cytochrome b [Proteobacteria bacterium]|nr:cytochrome b [Pseudomonadota bacterium]